MPPKFGDTPEDCICDTCSIQLYWLAFPPLESLLPVWREWGLECAPNSTIILFPAQVMTFTDLRFASHPSKPYGVETMQRGRLG